MDEKDHDEVQKLMNDLGLDMSTAIKIFFKQTLINRGLPFAVTESSHRNDTEVTRGMLKDMAISERQIREGKAKTFTNYDDLIKELND